MERRVYLNLKFILCNTLANKNKFLSQRIAEMRCEFFLSEVKWSTKRMGNNGRVLFVE